MAINSMLKTKPSKRIAFTLEQELEDAANEYVAAIYRYNKAESGSIDDQNEARCEMNQLEQMVLDARLNTYKGSVNAFKSKVKNSNKNNRCPKPEWDVDNQLKVKQVRNCLNS
jgi:lysyl-tRNA synthetase class I